MCIYSIHIWLKIKLHNCTEHAIQLFTPHARRIILEAIRIYPPTHQLTISRSITLIYGNSNRTTADHAGHGTDGAIYYTTIEFLALCSVFLPPQRCHNRLEFHSRRAHNHTHTYQTLKHTDSFPHRVATPGKPQNFPSRCTYQSHTHCVHRNATTTITSLSTSITHHICLYWQRSKATKSKNIGEEIATSNIRHTNISIPPPPPPFDCALECVRVCDLDPCTYFGGPLHCRFLEHNSSCPRCKRTQSL